MRVGPNELCRELQDAIAGNGSDLERISYEMLDEDLQNWCRGKEYYEINTPTLLLIQQIRLMREIK